MRTPYKLDADIKKIMRANDLAALAKSRDFQRATNNAISQFKKSGDANVIEDFLKPFESSLAYKGLLIWIARRVGLRYEWPPPERKLKILVNEKESVDDYSLEDILVKFSGRKNDVRSAKSQKKLINQIYSCVLKALGTQSTLIATVPTGDGIGAMRSLQLVFAQPIPDHLASLKRQYRECKQALGEGVGRFALRLIVMWRKIKKGAIASPENKY